MEICNQSVNHFEFISRGNYNFSFMTMQFPQPRNTKYEIGEKPRVLYLDDDDSNLVSFRANFRDQFEVHTSNNPVEAYNIVGEQRIEIVITDHNMPSMSGVEFLESISDHYPDVQRILLTGYTELVPVMEAVNNVRAEKTIILIAHRLSTVRDCDRIYLLDQGRLAGQGTYDEVARQNDQFRAMASGQR